MFNFLQTAGGLSSLLALALTLGATSLSADEGRRIKNVSEGGFSSGHSYETRVEKINEGFDVTHTFGHDYKSTWNVGEWSEPITRKGEVVGEKGSKWEKIANSERDHDKTLGTRWVKNAKSWNSGGDNRDFFKGSSRFFQSGNYGRYLGGAQGDDGSDD